MLPPTMLPPTMLPPAMLPPTMLPPTMVPPPMLPAPAPVEQRSASKPLVISFEIKQFASASDPGFLGLASGEDEMSQTSQIHYVC